MGEQQPPDFTIPLRPNLGQRALDEWNGEKRNTPTLPFQSKVLQPVRNIAPFQRRVEVQTVSVASATGERPLFTVVVPPREAWKIIYIDFFNDDDVGHDVILDFSRVLSPPTAARINIAKVAIVAQFQKLLYPLLQPLISVGSDTHFTWDGPLEFFEGDQIRIITEEVQNSIPGITYISTIRYELIPPARSIELGEPWTATVF